MDSAAPPATLSALIDTLLPQDGAQKVYVRDVMHRIGDGSFAPALLVVALVLVSPVSAIPGMPTLGGLIILLIALQWVAGRHHLWLPDVFMRRGIAAARMDQAVGFLRGPAAWIDRHSRRRLRILTRQPFRLMALLVIIATAATWPFLELLPMFTSVSAFAVSLFAIGLMTRDGAFIVAGYAFVAASAAIVAAIWQGLV